MTTLDLRGWQPWQAQGLATGLALLGYSVTVVEYVPDMAPFTGTPTPLEVSFTWKGDGPGPLVDGSYSAPWLVMS